MFCARAVLKFDIQRADVFLRLLPFCGDLKSTTKGIHACPVGYLGKSGRAYFPWAGALFVFREEQDRPSNQV